MDIDDEESSMDRRVTAPQRARGDEVDDELTPELTGRDASPEEAAYGDAGNGAANDADLVGAAPEGPWLEEEPGLPRDIFPDQIRQFPEARRARTADTDESEVTARPSEPPPAPMTSS
jgi:hypothetical protein